MRADDTWDSDGLRCWRACASTSGNDPATVGDQWQRPRGQADCACRRISADHSGEIAGEKYEAETGNQPPNRSLRGHQSSSDVVMAEPSVDLPICALSSPRRIVDESKHGTLMAHQKETSGYASVVRRGLGLPHVVGVAGSDCRHDVAAGATRMVTIASYGASVYVTPTPP